MAGFRHPENSEILPFNRRQGSSMEKGRTCCTAIRLRGNYQITGIAARVYRGSLQVQSGDFVARSPKPTGISELFGQTRQRYGLRRRVLRSCRFSLDDPIRPAQYAFIFCSLRNRIDSIQKSRP